MNKVTMRIDGMVCGMCEAHINDTIRKVYPKAKKVVSSRKRGQSVFLLDESIDEEKIKAAIAETGYECKDIQTEPYVKKGFLKR